jgi:hypothetical protein
MKSVSPKMELLKNSGAEDPGVALLECRLPEDNLMGARGTCSEPPMPYRLRFQRAKA